MRFVMPHLGVFLKPSFSLLFHLRLEAIAFPNKAVPNAQLFARHRDAHFNLRKPARHRLD